MDPRSGQVNSYTIWPASESICDVESIGPERSSPQSCQQERRTIQDPGKAKKLNNYTEIGLTRIQQSLLEAWSWRWRRVGSIPWTDRILRQDTRFIGIHLKEERTRSNREPPPRDQPRTEKNTPLIKRRQTPSLFSLCSPTQRAHQKEKKIALRNK